MCFGFTLLPTFTMKPVSPQLFKMGKGVVAGTILSYRVGISGVFWVRIRKWGHVIQDGIRPLDSWKSMCEDVSESCI